MTLDVYSHVIRSDDEHAAEIVDRSLRGELEKLRRRPD
jgi:hypothetical protein